MGKVLSFRDFLEKLETELQDFEAELNEVAQENKVDLDVVLESLDPLEMESYEYLQKRVEQLKRWEDTDRKYGAYRRAEGGN